MEFAKNLIELQRLREKTKSHEGFTLLEILIVLVIAGIMAAMSAPYISFGLNPLRDTTNRVAGIFKLVRSKAMAQTSAYRISLSPTSATQLVVERNRSCFNTTGWIADPSFTSEDLSLTEAEDIRGLAKNEVIQIVGARVNNVVTPLTTWRLCYNSRGLVESNQGLANTNLELTLRDIKTNRQNRIEVFSAGTVQTYEN